MSENHELQQVDSQEDEQLPKSGSCIGKDLELAVEPKGQEQAGGHGSIAMATGE